MIEQRLSKGLHYLKERGYKIKLGKHVSDVHGYLAGQDADRVHDLNSMLCDPEVDAVFCTRGGYGTPRILPHIDYEVIKERPKILVGYSDITALQLAIFARTGLVTFSGPMVAVELGKGVAPFTEAHFWPLLTSANISLKMTARDGPLERLKPGRATGTLLGGNLAMVCSLLGTEYLPDLRGAILVIEEIGEEPYRLDRMLTQLKLAGVLAQAGGLVLGHFSGCEPSSGQPSLTVEEIVMNATAGLEIPVVAGLPYGHGEVKYTLPLGARACLDAETGVLEVTMDEYPAPQAQL